MQTTFRYCAACGRRTLKFDKIALPHSVYTVVLCSDCVDAIADWLRLHPRAPVAPALLHVLPSRKQ